MHAVFHSELAVAIRRCRPFRHALGVASFFLAVLVSAPTAHAQSETGVVSGRVTNALTGRTLNNARVTIPAASKVAFTNEYGEFVISGVPAGEATLEVFFTGLDTKAVSVTVEPGETASANVVLSSAARAGTDSDGETIVLDAFNVEATEQDGAAIAVNEQRFSSNLKTVVAADAFGDVTEGNPGEFLKYLPGVSVDYVAADVRTVSVRGFGAEFTSVNVDGNRMASAASSGSSRTFEFEQVSMNNVARIEVVKVPTPSMPADSLGGSVNLISKNAFERDSREIKYRAYLSLNSEDLTFSKTPGPNTETSRKIRPGFDISYAEPFSSTFGIVANALRSDQFNEQHRSRNTWQISGGGATEANPYLRTYTFQDGPKETLRQSFGINADWKVTDHGVLSLGYQWNDYDSFFGNRNMNLNAGTNVTDFSADHTNGRAGAGEVTGGSSFRNKFGTTNHVNLDFKYFGPSLRVETGVFYSYASNKYRDIDNGYFSGVNTRLRNVTVAYQGIEAFKPTAYTVKNTAGADVDWTRLSNFNLRSVRSQQFDSWDEFTGGHIDVTKTLDALALPVEVKVGLNSRAQERDIIRRQDDYDYLGPDGVAESADDNAAPFLDTIYAGQDPGYGQPEVQWFDPSKVYQHFVANPSYFRPNVANWQNRVQNDYRIKETVTAAYLQGQMKFIDNRLSVLGGVRFEKTEVDGTGFLYLPDAIRNSSGGLITTDVYQQRRLQYQRRAAQVSTSYDGYYPSVHLTYNLTENLLLRAAYASTLGRPDFDNILPGTVIDPDDAPVAGQPGGNVTVRNTGLKPYEADNYDLSLEYYFRPAGVISLGIFQKNIDGFFGEIVKLVDQADLAAYNLDPQYLGYRLSTTVNSGDAKITGWEFNYMQQLVFLPGILKDFSVFANGTFLNLDGGVTADWSGFIEKTGNVGFSYTNKKFTGMVKWNYRGEQFRSFQTSVGTNGAEYYDDRLYLDLNAEYKFSKQFAVFANARNVLNTPQELLRYGDVTPGYASTFQSEDFGVQFAVGVKGTF